MQVKFEQNVKLCYRLVGKRINCILGGFSSLASVLEKSGLLQRLYLLSYDVENGTLKKVQVQVLHKSLLRSSVIIACALIGYVHSILALSESNEVDFSR